MESDQQIITKLQFRLKIVSGIALLLFLILLLVMAFSGSGQSDLDAGKAAMLQKSIDGIQDLDETQLVDVTPGTCSNQGCGFIDRKYKGQCVFKPQMGCSAGTMWGVTKAM